MVGRASCIRWSNAAVAMDPLIPETFDVSGSIRSGFFNLLAGSIKSTFGEKISEFYHPEDTTWKLP
jgi:hypothetical protein